MSKLSKWKLEKTKVKVVFRLQFHATHIPQSGWDKLFISLISAETGKATSKTTKANVKNGACKWGDAIYETTRLLQDSKTKQYEEKLYKILVAMGSSRASTLGEATINLSDYVDALKPSTVAVPLNGCNFGTILHLTVQLLTSKTGFREFEQQRELREKGFRSGVDGHGDSNAGDQTDNKVSARIKLKADSNELSSLEEEANLNEDYADSNSAAGFDGSSNTSESLNTEKHEIDFLKNIPFKQSPHALQGDTSDHRNSPQESSHNSINNELAATFEENTRLKESLELAESSIFNLKLEVSSLQSLADELGSNTHKISNVLASEIISTEELAKEVSFMKSECQKFKNDIIKIKDLKLNSQIPIMGTSDYSVGSENGFGLDLCPPDSILQNFSIIPPVLEIANPVVDAMKSQIFDLVRELDESKVEKEALTQKMDQMECYYESLIHELEENQKLMLVELNRVRSEHSTCIYTLSSSRDEMESMHQDMLRLADERLVIEEIGKEFERRAITSEAALRRARLNYSIAVDKLQKDLELLSSQVASMFETNECIIKQAFVEPSKVDDTEKFQISNLGPRKRSVGGDIILEDLKRSFCWQEELYQKVEKELIDMYSLNLNLDLYSKTLEGSLLEANSDIRILNKKTKELSEEVELSTASQNQLMVRLQEAKEEIHTLNEFKSSSISQCSDMALQNQVLEDKLESISMENHLFAQKLKDLEITKTIYQSKFETCLSENAKLSVSLKREISENEKLQIEMSILKAELEEVVSLKNNLEENISFVQDKLANLSSTYNKQLNVSATSRSIDSKDSILQLEEIQNNVCDKILKLREENQNLKGERDIFDVSLSRARLEIHVMKEKFKSEIQAMMTKLDLSNSLVQKLQTKLESVASKLRFSSEIDEAYAKKNEVLMEDLAVFENQMHELTSKNGLVFQEISGFDDLAEEIVRGKLTISDLMHDKQELVLSLQDKTEEAINLASEISSLKENLRNLQEDLIKEKIYKDELEGKVRELNLQLNMENNKISMSLQEKNEESVNLVSEINYLKEDLRNSHDELHKETVSKDKLEGKVRNLMSQLNEENDKYLKSLQDKTEESVKLVSEINSLKEDLGNLHDELNNEKAYKDELEGNVRNLMSQLKIDNDKFSMSLQEKNEESVKLAFEIGCLKENLRNLGNELHMEKTDKDELEEKIGYLTSQLNKETDKLALSLLVQDESREEKVYKDELEEKAGNLTSQLNKKNDNYVKSLQEKNEEAVKLLSEINSLKEDLRNLHDELHKEKVYKDELEGKVRDLTFQLKKDNETEGKVRDLNEKLFNLEHQKVEFLGVRKLASDFEMVKLQEELSCQEIQLFEMHDSLLVADLKFIYFANQYKTVIKELFQKLISSQGCLEELQKRYHDLETISNGYIANEARLIEEKSKLLKNLNSLSDSNNNLRNQLEECLDKLKVAEMRFSMEDEKSLKDVIIDLEEEISSLNVTKEELEILGLVLRGKAIEKCAEVANLSQKLSEQVLKTEEYKNLSTRLNELKDELEAECLVAREKREVVAVQDSLRVAFIKEQYETKIQELNHKFSISKRHGEEMLIKLQDSIDEIENRKRSEAVNSKKIEELSLKLIALESELQLAITEKREKISAYDRTKAELECALLSLECCKEEKEKLEALFQEFEAGKSELAVELTLAKGELEILKSPIKVENGSQYKLNGSIRNSSPILLKLEESIPDGESATSNETTKLQVLEIPKALEIDESSKSNGKHLDTNGEFVGAQILRSSMEHLHEQLEKMKNENAAPLDTNHETPDFQVPEKEIMQLHKANEELRSMFPSFDEISGGGNALEKVLALEIELAEALKAKNNQNSLLQSSFLKQHSNEDALLKTFRDINELIKEMLELKGRHTNVETELRDMHDRYSKLSLQFAEVEGERQKLKMTLKNVRASRKLLHSSSSDLPS